MAKTSTVIGDVADSFLEKKLLPTAKQGTYLIPGTEEEVRGKAAAIKKALDIYKNGEPSPTLKNVVNNAEIAQDVHELREGGMSQADIAEKVGLSVVHVGNLLRWATADPIVWTDEMTLAEKVIKARDEEKTSWAGIAIRAGVTKGYVQRLYKEHSKKDPAKSDIGKGGRRKATYHSGAKKKAVAKKAPAKKKATAKKAPAKKAPAKSGSKKTAKKAPAKKKATSTKAKSEKAAKSSKAEIGDEDTPF